MAEAAIDFVSAVPSKDNPDNSLSMENLALGLLLSLVSEVPSGCLGCLKFCSGIPPFLTLQTPDLDLTSEGAASVGFTFPSSPSVFEQLPRR